MTVTWPLVRLDEISRPKQWKTIPKSEMNDAGPYPVFGANGIIGRYDKFNHECATILITCRGATCGTINVCEPKSWVTGNAMALDDLDTSRVDFRYLVHALQADGLQVAVNGAAQPQITRKSLEMVKIPLPPIEEQRRIAAVLDAADALRAKRRQAIAKLDTLTQAIFIDMFGDPATTDAEDPCSLEEVADLQIGYPFKSNTFTADAEGTRILRGANVLPGKVHWKDTECVPESIAEEQAQYVLEADDIVVAMDRPWISSGFKIAPVLPNDSGSLLVQRVARLRAKKGFPASYVYELMRLPAFTRHCAPTETTIPHISPKDFRSFEFDRPKPAVLAQWAEASDSISTSLAAAVRSAEHIDTLFASLQQRAFRGEL